VDQVGDKLDVMMDSGIQRGTHIVKALAMGAKAVGIGRGYLFPLAAAGQAGVERMVGLLKDEVERDMRLMGAATVSDLTRDMLRPR
jgi:L-lactate dehydrogenase (cytochrome)